MEDSPKIIVVEDENKIFMLQGKFNRLFPYLRIELFSAENKQGDLITNKFTNEIGRSLRGYRVSNKDEQIVITPEMTVAALEEKFKEIYDLKAQILRKSGKIWLETTITDAWTLKEQNLQGEALSKHIN